MFLLRLAEQLFRLTRLIILARVLAPTDFGLMGIALVTLAMLETFSDVGLQAALIRKKGEIESYLDTAWTIGIIRGAILFVLLWFVAPLAGRLFDTTEAVPVIRAISIVILLRGFTNVAALMLPRELAFGKQFVYQLSSTLVNFVVAVTAALALRNVWALVYGMLAGEVVRLVMSFVIQPRRPRFAFDRRKAGELWRFGRWLLGSSIVVFLCGQGDDVVVGGMLGATMLAFYQMAFRISGLASTEFAAIVGAVVFPAFSKIQGNLPLLRTSYLKSLQFTTLFSFPMMGGIFVLAPELTRTVLGEKWLAIVPVIQVLALSGIFRAIATPGPLFLAIGKPQIRTKLQLLTLTIMATLIFPLTARWAIVGTAIATATALGVSGTAALVVAFREIGSSARDGFRILFVPLFATLVAVAVVYFARENGFPAVTIWGVAALLGIGVLSYSILVVLADATLRTGNGRMLRDQLAAISGRKANEE